MFFTSSSSAEVFEDFEVQTSIFQEMGSIVLVVVCAWHDKADTIYM